MKTTKIFLTGATGLVGKPLLEHLIKDSFNITALSRNIQLPIKNVTWQLADISKNDISLFNQIESSDIIIHNAACINTGKTQAEIDEIENVNINFTRNLLTHASKGNLKKIIFSSGLSIIKKPLPELIYEDSELAPSSAYSKSKYIGEQLIQEFASKYGINYNILRLSSPITFNINLLPNTVVKKWLLQSINKENISIFGEGKRTQDFVAVDDIANAFLSCIEHDTTNGIYNVSSGTSISMLELAQLITNKFKNKYNFSNFDENENDRWNISIEKAKRELNFNPKYTSEEVIRELLNNIAH